MGDYAPGGKKMARTCNTVTEGHTDEILELFSEILWL